MGIQPEKWGARKNDKGESVFPKTDLISLFLGLLIYVLLHIGMNTESCGGSAVLTFIKIRCFTEKGLRDFMSSSGHETC